MRTPSAKRDAIGFSIGVLYYLWLSTIFVPLSSQSDDSWAPFLKSWAIRLVVSVVFLALTRRVLKNGTVANQRITPGPQDPDPDKAPYAAEEQTVTPPSAPRPWPRWKALLVLSTGLAAFALGFAINTASYLPFHFTPGPITALLSALCGSLFAAALAAVVLAVALSWIQKPHVPTLTRGQKLFVVICFVYTASYWVRHSSWLAQQQWFGRFMGNLVNASISLFAIACFAILWLPKPSDQPELLHVAPGKAERR